MNICKFCGTEIGDGHKFCSRSCVSKFNWSNNGIRSKIMDKILSSSSIKARSDGAKRADRINKSIAMKKHMSKLEIKNKYSILAKNRWEEYRRNKTYPIKKCMVCGLDFISKNNKKNTCSKSCTSKLAWITFRGKNSKIVKCAYCKKEMVLLLKDTKKYCSNKCSAKSEFHNVTSEKMKLDGNYAWLGGITFEPYGVDFNKSLKEKIRDRDFRKCKICNIPEIECSAKLTVHHIDYDKHNNLENNLISLCRICHGKTNFNRDYWQRDLGFMVEESEFVIKIREDF